ncbi:MAG TPA: hypothetical protein VI072_27270 [Polyangiaceae bacterium]
MASCRGVPVAHAEHPLNELLGASRNEALGEKRVEISRVVVNADLRGRQLSELMLYFVTIWLLENTRFERYDAVCVERLASFYEHFGARRLTTEAVELADRGAQRYFPVHGDLRSSADGLLPYLTSRGWTLSHTPSDAPGARHDAAVVARPVGEGLIQFDRPSGPDSRDALATAVVHGNVGLWLDRATDWSTELGACLDRVTEARRVDHVVVAHGRAEDAAALKQLARGLPHACIYVPAESISTADSCSEYPAEVADHAAPSIKDLAQRAYGLSRAAVGS